MAPLAVVLLPAHDAHAWSIGSQLNYSGCHETITAAALRNARATLATAPVLTPTRDEAALIDEVQFVPPADFVNDIAAMSLLLGVRDNDLKGHNPLDSLQLVEVHGNPDTQQEHCIRSATDDGLPGNETALEACRAFIHQRATEALDGLAADGAVDPNRRMPLKVFVSFAGQIDPSLPMFYVKMGQAMHALEDGFTHTYRTTDGAKVTVVTNWIDNVSGTAANEQRDGPVHLVSLDHCENMDPLVARNFQLATQAATELLTIALDPSKTRDAKIAAFDVLTTKYLSYQPGCTFETKWCDAREPKVVDSSGCDVGRGGTTPWGTLFVVGGAMLLATRKRAALIAASLCLVLAVAPSYADNPKPTAPATPPTPATPVATPPAIDPAVPVIPQKPEDVAKAQQGQEPGRDVKTPTVTEVQSVREDKRLGSPYGFAAMIGGSVDHGAGALTIAGRYRLSEKWVFGIDGQWNPWVTSAPLSVKAGVINVFGTVIRRFPMKFDRVNLRTSFHFGVSTLLFDVHGAPMYSTGPYAAFTPLGIDYDLGNSVRIVLDPVEIALPMPHVGLIPLYYEQFRLMIGIQIGA